MKGTRADAELEAPRRRIIERPRLTRLLDEAEARILLLVAPAGYGKTTLARQWLGAGGRTAIWVDGSPARADVESFALALRNALRPRWPGTADALEQRLRAGGAPNPAQLGDFLAAPLEWDEATWLVIDDYHAVMENAGVETLVEAFIDTSSANALIASRVRPRWATARRLIYGEIEELGKSALAMTREEATQVLRREKSGGLIALADGWPAIIALAADAKLSRLPGEELPGSLYDFFAEELLEVTDQPTRDGLTLLAFAPTITHAVSEHLLGNQAHDVLIEGIRLGFIDRKNDKTYQMHSLIREFLLQRAEDLISDREQLIQSLATALDPASLDDLFVLALDFPESPSLRDATDRALRRLLEQNRLELIRPWFEHAIALGLDTPTVEVATAELVFREGKYKQSEAAALRASETLAVDDSLASRAMFRAGLSAYHRNDPESALKHHRVALDRAQTNVDRLQGLWGLLIATLELEGDAPWLLAELESLPPTPMTQVRLANAKLSYALRGKMSVADALPDAEAVVPLLSRVDDPMVHSAFLNQIAGNLVLAARYRDASALADDEIEIIRNYGLSFALRHALTVRGAARAGLRHFAEATRSFNEAERLARESDDAFSVANVALYRVQGEISRGDLQAAIVAAEIEPVTVRGVSGELLAAQALALAATGETEAARKGVERARHLTTSTEARDFAAWTDVISAMQTEAAEAAKLLSTTLDESFRRGSLHGFVCSYRAFPSLLVFLRENGLAAPRVHEVIRRANDATLARRAGIPVKQEVLKGLSRRETEVARLLAEGLTNRGIAERLFISEVTVKVHLRRVFDKLGARSRTEAALIAASGLLDES